MNIPSEGTHLLHFTADWCGPCKRLKPVLDEVVEETGVSRIVVDMDKDPEVADSLKVMSVPTLVLVKDGNVVATMVGLRSKDIIKTWLEAAE